MKPSGILLFVFLISGSSSNAQYFNLGQDPSALRWRQVRSEHFQVIFPQGYESEGIRFTSLLEEALPLLGKDLRHPLRRFPVVIHNQSVTSNGVVSWAPRRMELYPCPPQDIYPQDWLEQLAIHELRHVVQLSTMDRGFTRFLGYLLGQQAAAAITGLFVPSWFLEGDAVVAETAFTRSGRGRVPLFEAEQRAQLLAEGVLSYDKAMFGSFKDPMPDRYVFGYHLVAGGRKLFGPGLWQQALEEAAARPFLLTPFSHGLRKHSGLSKDRLYKRVMKHLDSLWTEEARNGSPPPAERLTPLRNTYHSEYHFPASLDKGRYFCFHKSLDHIPRFIVFRPGQKERVLFTPGAILEDAITFQDGKIYWAEEVPDIRWQNRRFSVIRIYDTLSGHTTTLGKRSRYAAPSPSPDGTKIVASETRADGSNGLVILDASTGEVLRHMQGPDNMFFLTPVFDDMGNKILAVGVTREGKTLVELDPGKGAVRFLIPFTRTEISGPVYQGNQVFFIGGYQGVDEVYSLDTATGLIMRVIASRYGAKDISFNPTGDSLLYVEYEHGGHKICNAPIYKREWEPIQRLRNSISSLETTLSRQENTCLFTRDTVRSTPYETSPYRKTTGLFNLHSWSPFYLDAGSLTADPGIQFLSQNLLSTSFLSLGAGYNRYEKVWRYHVDYTYAGFFPVMDIGYEDGGRAISRIHAGSQEAERISWRERSLNAYLRVPLNFTRNKYLRGIEPSAGIRCYKAGGAGDTSMTIRQGQYQSLDGQLTAYNILKYTERDLYPRFGQWIRVSGKKGISGDLDPGSLWASEVFLFFPGVFLHQTFRVNLAYQVRKWGRAGFSDLVFSPRGPYDLPAGEELQVMALSYDMPLAYPDLSIPGLLYVKRISGGLFSDFARTKGGVTVLDYTSWGADLKADLHLFRFYAPLEAGLRTAFVPGEEKPYVEFLFNIDFSSF